MPYQVVEIQGVGVMESPFHSVPLLDEVFKLKLDAEKRAQDLWFINTTEEERASGWCGLHYTVIKLEIK